MPSFSEICRHRSVLVIDAASAVIQVGVLGADGTAKWTTSGEEAGIGVFRCVEQLGVDPQRVTAFVFCEGPGSVLGIRTVAMTLRMWDMLRPRPIYAYTSLALVAHALGRLDVGVVTDARRELWHHYQIGRGLRRFAAGELAGEIVMPENFRHWSPLPPGVTPVPYSLMDLFTLPTVAEADLFRETEAPDAFLHEEPSYVTWKPQIHRAPTTR